MTSQVLGLGLAGHGLGLGLMGHVLDSITADHIIRSPVSCADDEHVLLAAHSVHFGKELIYDPVRSATSVTDTATSRLGNGVEFIKEENTRCSRSRL